MRGGPGGGIYMPGCQVLGARCGHFVSSQKASNHQLRGPFLITFAIASSFLGGRESLSGGAG